MTTTKILRTIMFHKEMKMVTLANRLNARPNTVLNRINQENISVDKLNEMLRVMDYKLMVVPSDTRAKEGEFEVE